MADARDETSAGLSETELRPPERNFTAPPERDRPATVW